MAPGRKRNAERPASADAGPAPTSSKKPQKLNLRMGMLRSTSAEPETHANKAKNVKITPKEGVTDSAQTPKSESTQPDQPLRNVGGTPTDQQIRPALSVAQHAHTTATTMYKPSWSDSQYKMNAKNELKLEIGRKEFWVPNTVGERTWPSGAPKHEYIMWAERAIMTAPTAVAATLLGLHRSAIVLQPRTGATYKGGANYFAGRAGRSEAVIAYTVTGCTLNAKPCSHCTHGAGMFTECIGLEGQFNEACLNCVFICDKSSCDKSVKVASTGSKRKKKEEIEVEEDPVQELEDVAKPAKKRKMILDSEPKPAKKSAPAQKQALAGSAKKPHNIESEDDEDDAEDSEAKIKRLTADLKRLRKMQKKKKSEGVTEEPKAKKIAKAVKTEKTGKSPGAKPVKGWDKVISLAAKGDDEVRDLGEAEVLSE